MAAQCTHCGAQASTTSSSRVVGPHVFCSTSCRNQFLPDEYLKLRAAAMHALAYVRSKQSRIILLAALRGTYTVEG